MDWSFHANINLIKIHERKSIFGHFMCGYQKVLWFGLKLVKAPPKIKHQYFIFMMKTQNFCAFVYLYWQQILQNKYDNPFNWEQNVVSLCHGYKKIFTNSQNSWTNRWQSQHCVQASLMTTVMPFLSSGVSHVPLYHYIDIYCGVQELPVLFLRIYVHPQHKHISDST